MVIKLDKDVGLCYNNRTFFPLFMRRMPDLSGVCGIWISSLYV